MSDPFFQKKRKRTDSAGKSEGGRGGRGGGKFGTGRGGGRGGGNADRSKQPRAGAAGPSRLRMREKAGKGRGGDDDDDENLPRMNGRADASDDDADSGDEGGIEAMDLAHKYEEDLEASDEDAIDETPAEARVRLAKMYLDSLRAYQDEDGLGAGEINAADVDRENISARLQRDAASHSTHMHDLIADRIRLPPKGDTTHILACRGHRLSVTSASVSHDCTSIWTAGKDGRIIRWRLRDGKMVEMISRASTSAETINGNGFAVNGARKNGNGKQSGSSGAARRRARAQAAAAAEQDNGQNENDARENGKEHCRLVVPAAGSGHTDEIWSLTSSQDGKFLATGGKDRRICIWATKSIEKSSKDELTSFVKSLGGHRDSITALRFRHGTYDLFSASFDRTLKLFDISQLSYVETFFGHQEEIPSLDILRGEVAVSAGARDRTCRWWKVRDESQLVFRGGAKSRMRDVLEGGDIMEEEQEEGGPIARSERKQLIEGSIDAVAMIDEHTFLSGGDTGTISLWSLAKKKPVFTFSAAHGFEQGPEGTEQQPRWITSLTCLPYGDVFASGSWDGSIRLWKLSPTLKSFSALVEVPALGFVNSLQLMHPNKSIMKKRGGSVIEPDQWRRHGGLQGGAKKVFSDAEGGASEANSEGEEEAAPIPSKDGSTEPPLILIAALGQEPTRGRWQKLKEARNGTLVVPFSVGSL
ncbi:WD40 repeat-like protein [Meira miltonrushii]|uniref:WD40 repeat-like protein n=1 Tax=Meira miltonrushii TaxID=1280837 RepID=A0A316VLD3_9BASI|nr:WD40 repeat-like protein [Meira miltonrushii]PWN38270.1 WD40 repeat-like protein [Meira miltonrushii]